MRVGHLQYVAQPGGDQAVKEPWRMAVSYLHQAGIEVTEIFTQNMSQIKPDKLAAVEQMLEQDINCPLTSSLGRLFAAVAALLGLCLKRSYQGQAALKLETAAQTVNNNDSYNYQISKRAGQYQILITTLIKEIAADLRAGVDAGMIARKFHNTVINFSVRLCEILRLQFKLDHVVLSGGVWQNQILLIEVYRKLTAGGFKVHLPHKIPCTDEGLAVGQLAVANYQERGHL
ncbi:hydrogenase maturation factor HypF (carbamoyltransferase family) [Halanaerobacter jeridensis]|uniref:Hydrogenase maturation factor HypF (Carbamoyltransferase family) n=2 Tax=Halanaerobacter jeridensis TaxID=706427 RepID=A0A938XRI8_9FIRM|nr:hydrogenase maturation factor HypF (carbamoyltransferase family) [Halanaerobacter jeridensis]